MLVPMKPTLETIQTGLDFSEIDPVSALKVQLAIGRGENFYGYLPSDRFTFFLRNYVLLAQMGVLEEAWLDAYVFASNFAAHDVSLLKSVFEACDRARLRELAPIVATPMTLRNGRITLFRGCAGPSHTLGMSWTTSLDKAIWYSAHKVAYQELVNPAVYVTTASIDDIYCCLNRNEDEYIFMASTVWKVDVPSAEFRLDRQR